MDWCPDRFTFGTMKESRGQWCPVNLGVLKTIGGEIGPFTGGENALRVSTGVEMRFTPIVFRIAAGIGTEQYKRSAIVSLSAGITFAEFSVGFDL
jgi:hypothetical protein